MRLQKTALLILLLSFGTATATQAQNIIAAHMIKVRDSLFLKKVRIDSFSLDETFSAASDRKLPSSLAVKTYVDTHLGTRPLSTGAPSTGDVVKWNGTQWEPDTDATGGGGGLTNGDKVDITVSGDGDTLQIDPNTVGPTELVSTAVSPGSYTLTALTVDADGRITAASNGSEVDGDSTNELQTIDTFRVHDMHLEISLEGDNEPAQWVDVGEIAPIQTITAGDGIGVLPAGTDVLIENTGDLSDTNEAQTLSTSGTSTPVATLSTAGGAGGGTVTFQSGTGIGLNHSLGAITITNNGDTDGTDDVEDGDAAGGDLTGTYPNPTVAVNVIDSSNVADNTLTYNDLTEWGANEGDVLKYFNGRWHPRPDSVGTGGGTIDGSGTTNFMAKWLDSNTLTDGLFFDNGTTAAVNMSSGLSTDGRFNVMGSGTPATGAILFRNASSPTHGTMFRHKATDLDYDTSSTTGWTPTDWFMWGSSLKNTQAVDYPSVPNDNYVYGFGFNWGPQGSVVGSKPAAGFTFEQNYHVPGIGQCIEVNAGVNMAGGGADRFLYYVHTHTGSTSRLDLSASTFNVNAADQTTNIINANTTTGVTGIEQFRVSTPADGTAVFAYRNAANSAYISALKSNADNSLEVNEASSNTYFPGSIHLDANSPTTSRLNFTGSGTTRAYISANTGTGEIQHYAGTGGYYQTFYSNNAETLRLQSGSAYVPGYNTSNYRLRVGDFCFQPYSLNNAFIAENAYFNGSSWSRLNTGYASAVQLYSGQVFFGGQNTGSGTFAAMKYPLKVNHAGEVALGGDITQTPGSYTGAKMLVEAGGNIGMGVLSSISARVHVQGSGATSGSDALLVENSSGTDILVVQDDAKVGILTASPAVSLDMGSATDAARLPNGTTAQRPTAAAGQIRYNSTVGGLEVRDGSKWIRLTSSLTPGIAAGAAAGTGPTVSVTGNDLAGSISITTGTSTTTGTLCTITFNQAFDGGAQITVQLDETSDAAIAHDSRFGVGSAGNTSFVVTAPTALDASTPYVFTYTIHQ